MVIFNNNEQETSKNIDVCDLHYCAFAYIIFTFGMVGSLPSSYRLLNFLSYNYDTEQRHQAAQTAGEIFQETYRRLEERKSESSSSSQGETNASQSLRSRVGKTAAEEQKVVIGLKKQIAYGSSQKIG